TPWPKALKGLAQRSSPDHSDPGQEEVEDAGRTAVRVLEKLQRRRGGDIPGGHSRDLRPRKKAFDHPLDIRRLPEERDRGIAEGGSHPVADHVALAIDIDP